ncbi:hypothetical protein MSAN_00334400 [Mycena sanguinolenta]|uniref:DUF6534 domain-containing protein n=1 Tax=Mycena sanguinolenta TaxID=230812 RepID=A0A8H6Z8Y5_9AGAR|nr:hypothetical protein MSAN_00334400 [Mycena sanguinolenta]
MSLPKLDTVTGALLIGTWLSSLFYTVEVIQLARYFKRFKNDGWMLKLFVSLLFGIDTVSMVGNYIGVYLYTITHAYDSAYLLNQNWPIPLYLFATGLVAASVQLFLIIRYWRLTRNLFTTPILFLLVLVAFGGAYWSGITIAIFPAFADRAKVRIPAATWLISEAIADVCIAAALIWEFRKARTVFTDTKSILNRLVALTIQSGGAGAAIALSSLIAFLCNNESNVPAGIAYCLGRVYILTMLANLNLRQSGRNGSSRATPSLQKTHGARSTERGMESEGVEHYGGIHVHRTVHIEDFSQVECAK